MNAVKAGRSMPWLSGSPGPHRPTPIPHGSSATDSSALATSTNNRPGPLDGFHRVCSPTSKYWLTRFPSIR